MKNVERRRKIRKIVPIAILAGIAVIAAGLVLFALLHKKDKPAPDNEASYSASPTAAQTQPAASAPTETLTEAPSETPEAQKTDTPRAEQPTDTPEAATETPEDTEAPSEEPTLQPTATPDPEVPVRISDESSRALVIIGCGLAFNASGEAEAVVSGSAALEFVNNTDSVLYKVVLLTGGMNVTNVTLDGVPASFDISEGKLTIPFVNELKQGESNEIYFEFSGRCPVKDKLYLFGFWYDTSFTLTVYADSELSLDFDGTDGKLEKSDRGYKYSLEDASVHEAAILFRY